MYWAGFNLTSWCCNSFSDSLTASNTDEEIESLSTVEEQGNPSITEEISEDEMDVWKPQQEEATPLEEQEGSPSPAKSTAAGDRYVPSPSSSSVEFSSQPSVRQSLLLTRKETMLQQARK